MNYIILINISVQRDYYGILAFILKIIKMR